jgi:heme exporter protein A
MTLRAPRTALDPGPPPSPPGPVDQVVAAPQAIELRGVSKRFGRQRALARVDFSVRAGTSVVITGPNGAGKSTLLNVISGLASPTAGSVALAGLRPGDGSRGHGRVLGVLDHTGMHYDRLSGRENLRLHATLRGLPASSVEALLTRVDLTHAADRPVSEYSHGMRKRLALARVLLHDPPVLILDEPFSGLDAASQERLSGVLESLRGRHTIVFSTHDLARAHAHADRVLTLAGGRIVSDRWLAGGGGRAPPGDLARPTTTPPQSAVARFARTAVAMLRKDLLVEARGRSVSTAMLMLSGLLAVVLGMAFEPLATDPAVLSGALWVLITFTALHGLARSFDAEFTDHALQGIVLTGADPAAVYLGKVVANALLLVVGALASIVLIAVFFGTPSLAAALPGLVVLVGLAALGLATVGGVVTVLARHSRLGETLLPLLLLPLVVPVLLAGVATVPVLLETGSLDPGWLRVLVAYDVGMLAATTMLFEHLLEA